MGEKSKKTGSNGKKFVSELSKPSGGLGMGKGRRSLETCFDAVIPDSGIML